jgi:hypothetical protein
MPEIFDDYNYSQIFPGLLWHALYNNIASKETFTHMAKEWMKVRDKMYSDGDISRQKVDAINDAFAKKDIFVDAPSFGQQKENIKSTITKMIQEELQIRKSSQKENINIRSLITQMIKEEGQTLQEGRYEAATTELTRMVMPTIKYIIQKLLPHTTEPDKYSANGIHTLEKKVYVSGKSLPKELDDKMYMAEFRFFADPKLFEETGDKFQVGGSFMSDPYDRKGSFFQISSYFDPSMTLQDINAYLADLKGITIHEIQHGAQEEDVFATGDARHSNPLGDGRHNHNTIDGIRAYYASAAEVDSYTKEIYKKAKYHKKPFPEVMDARLQQFFDMFRRRRNNMNAEDERETPGEFRVKYSEEELNAFFFKELRDIFITGAKKKYPEAQGI